MTSHFPEIKASYHQNSFRAERRQEKTYVSDGPRNALVSSNKLAPGKTNLIERSLLGLVSGSRLAGRRTYTGIDPSPSRVHISSYSNPRDAVVSRESFLPEVLLPGPFTHFSHAEAKPEKTNKNVQGIVHSSRVEAALEIVRKLKDLRRENQSLGVPKDFTFANTGCIIVEEDESLLKRDRRRKKAERELRKKEKQSRQEATLRGKPNTTRNKLSRELDFRRAKTTIEEIGVKWKPPSENLVGESNQKQKPWAKWDGPKSASRDNKRGALCKVKYPLAEAMTREGTSAEKRRGRTLQQGDWKIMKIWPREANKIQPNILPIQMANEDIPLLRKIYEMAKCYDNAVDICSLDNDGTSSPENYSEEELMEEEQSEGRTDSNDAISLNSYQGDTDRPVQASDGVDKARTNASAEGSQQRHATAASRPSALDNIQQSSTGEDGAEQNADGESQTSSDAEVSQTSAEKRSDSQIQSDSEDRARIQRSWLHVASAVLSAESGGT